MCIIMNVIFDFIRSLFNNTFQSLQLDSKIKLHTTCLRSFVCSFQAKEGRSSLKRRLDARLSRSSSTEKEPAGESEGKKESDENKENWRLDEYLSDQDSWNESVISGRSAVGARALQYSLCFYLPL